MPRTLQVIRSITPPGLPQRTVTDEVDGDNLVQSTPSVSAALAGTLSTRTDNDTGILTVSTGHGLLTSDLAYVFWDGGSRRGMTITAVGATTVSVDGGTGDNLPIVATAITVMKPDEEVFNIVGSNAKTLTAYSPDAGYVIFSKSDDTVVLALKLAAGETYSWHDDSALANPVMIDNPLAGNTIAKVLFAHSGITAVTMEATAIRD